MRTPNYSRRLAERAFSPTRPLFAAALLLGMLIMLPASALAQAAQSNSALQPSINTADFVLLSGNASDNADGIENVSNSMLAQVSGKYIPTGSANAIQPRNPGVILWDEGRGSRAGTKLQSGASSNHQSNSLTLVSP